MIQFHGKWLLLHNTPVKITTKYSNIPKNNQYAFDKLTPENKLKIEKFLGKGMLWHEFSNKAKPDNKIGRDSFIKIHKHDPFKLKEGKLAPDTFYCHIRPFGGSKFRLFGVCQNATFHITHFDPDGKIHRESH